ncbi:MAG: hypothetical protein GX628_10390 [Clostridiales bacterium]|nr:hypothetical protein [Clostridiales bacterium]
MKKLALSAALFMLLAALLSLSVSAYDEVQLVGTNAPPAIDGKLDKCYMKIHDFYSPDVKQWYDANDTGHKGAGEAWGTWDKDNFYCFFKIAEKTYTPKNKKAEAPGADYSSMYLAILATLPKDNLPEDPNYVMQCCFNRSVDNTLEWKYTGSVPEQYRDNSSAYAIYKECPFKFECINEGGYTYYECAMPWNQIDRTGKIQFVEGHKWFFNYIITWCDETGAFPILQYGQGLMNDVYDMGANMTLVAPPVAAVTTTAAAAGSPASAQTFDITAIAAFAAVVSLAGCAVSKKRR